MLSKISLFLQVFGADDVLCTRIYVREWCSAASFSTGAPAHLERTLFKLVDILYH